MTFEERNEAQDRIERERLELLRKAETQAAMDREESLIFQRQDLAQRRADSVLYRKALQTGLITNALFAFGLLWLLWLQVKP